MGRIRDKLKKSHKRRMRKARHITKQKTPKKRVKKTKKVSKSSEKSVIIQIKSSKKNRILFEDSASIFKLKSVSLVEGGKFRVFEFRIRPIGSTKKIRVPTALCRHIPATSCSDNLPKYNIWRVQTDVNGNVTDPQTKEQVYIEYIAKLEAKLNKLTEKLKNTFSMHDFQSYQKFHSTASKSDYMRPEPGMIMNELAVKSNERVAQGQQDLQLKLAKMQINANNPLQSEPVVKKSRIPFRK